MDEDFNKKYELKYDILFLLVPITFLIISIIMIVVMIVDSSDTIRGGSFVAISFILSFDIIILILEYDLLDKWDTNRVIAELKEEITNFERLYNDLQDRSKINDVMKQIEDEIIEMKTDLKQMEEEEVKWKGKWKWSLKKLFKKVKK